VPAERLRQWILQGRANRNTLVQAEGATSWKPLSLFPEFSATLGSVASTLPAPQPVQPASDGTNGMAVASLVAGILSLPGLACCCPTLVTAPLGTTLDEAQRILARHKIEKLPVVTADGTLKGLITVKDIFKRQQYPDANKDRHGRLRVAAAVGADKDAATRSRALLDAGCDVLVLDSAHGHSEGVLQAVAELREAFPEAQLVGGNVATQEGACALVERGVDAVKVGVGPGSICTTRVVTGVGVPQFTAVFDAVAGANGVPVIADGGVKYSGDAVKALAAGADCVMMGAMLAGTEEGPGESLLLEGRRFKVIRGMGSLAAMQEGSADRYFQEGEMSSSKLVPEGIEGRVPYKGPAADVLYQLVGGLRSAMGYCGCRTVHELRTETVIVRQTVSGVRESHPHDVVITREAPNYSG
jgi:IMP dehydrogenase